MVQDIRKMIFSSSELLSAFEGYARVTPQFLPGGRLISCTPIDNDGVKLEIEMEYGSSSHKVEFIYRGIDVLRPLILFCIENNIVLPRDGRKSFSIIDGRAVVMVDLNLDLELSAIALPMLGEHIHLIKSDAPRSRPASTQRNS